MGQDQKGLKNRVSGLRNVPIFPTNVAYVLTCPISRLRGSEVVCQEQGSRESDFELTESWAASQLVFCLRAASSWQLGSAGSPEIVITDYL